MDEKYKKLLDPNFSTHLFGKGNGDNRAIKAISLILRKIRDGNYDISKTKCVLLQIASGESEITIDEIGIINDEIQKIDNHITILMSVLEKDIGDEIEVKTIFTDLDIKDNVDIEKAFNSKPQLTKSLPIYLLEDEYSVDEISEIISFLSDIYQDIGGDQLRIRGFQSIEVESPEPILY